MNELEAILKLKTVKGLGPRKTKLLIQSFGSGIKIFEADELALSQVESVGPSLIKAIQEAKQSDFADKELERAAKIGVRLIHYLDETYPECLKTIYDPPSLLYVRGVLPRLEGPTPKSIGIVGTRNASDYALSFTRHLAESLAANNVVINSGLALGIDAAAHTGAISNGQTIAVLGSGVDVIYPSQNRSLARQIYEGQSALISEYALGTRPIATNFPGRNRIINGLSRGVVVIEAGEKSGALITTDYALQEGRQVFAVPGRPGDMRSSGSHQLLKQGAIFVDSPEDILNEFHWTALGSSVAKPELTSDEQAIIDVIHQRENVMLDHIASELDTPAQSLLPILTMLELKGVIKTLPNGRYLCLISM